jgi:hypothetical protein
MVADELRRQADVFVDLVTLQSKVGRDPSERPMPREPRVGAPSRSRTTTVPQGNDTDFDN